MAFADNGGFGNLLVVGIICFGFMLNRFNNGNGSGFLRRFFDTFNDFFRKDILHTLTRNCKNSEINHFDARKVSTL